MAKKKITRKELLKDTDEFLTYSGKAMAFINAHLRQLGYVGIGIAVVIVVYLAVNTYFRYVNKKGQLTYDTAYETLEGKMRPDNDPEKISALKASFETVSKKYGISKAARLSLPQLAYLSYLEKEYDEAISQYRQFHKEVKGDREYEALASLALAACYEAKGETKMAMAILDPIIESTADPFREAVMYHLARLYRLDKNEKKANEILKTFVEKYQDSPFLPMAEARL